MERKNIEDEISDVWDDAKGKEKTKIRRKKQHGEVTLGKSPDRLRA